MRLHCSMTRTSSSFFREGVRASEQMQPIAKGLKDVEISKLAEHFSGLPAKQMESGTTDPALMKRGLERASALRCGQCHLPDFRGQSQIPRLASQREAYLALAHFLSRSSVRAVAR